MKKLKEVESLLDAATPLVSVIASLAVMVCLMVVKPEKEVVDTTKTVCLSVLAGAFSHWQVRRYDHHDDGNHLK